MQDSNGNTDKECGLCTTRDEEDMLLITMLLIEADPSMNDWAFSGLAPRSESEPGANGDPAWEEQLKFKRLLEIFKLSNFRKLVADLFLHKHPNVSRCQHEDYAR